jgi:ATP-dependent Lon protease
VIIPEQNKKELVEIPEDIRKKMKFHPVKDMDDVIRLAFKKAVKTARTHKTRSRKSRRASA